MAAADAEELAGGGKKMGCVACVAVGAAKNGVGEEVTTGSGDDLAFISEADGVDAMAGVVVAEEAGGEAATAAAAAAAFPAAAAAKLLWRKSGGMAPEKARKEEASLSAANWRFHLFRRF